MRDRSGRTRSATASVAVVAAALWAAAAGAASPLTSAVFVARALTLHVKHHASTLLDDGTVLITGGVDDGGTVQSAAMIYDPATGVTATLSATLTVARMGHTATLLPDGRVLIAGGTDATNTVVASAELYTPSTRSFAAVGATMSAPRTFHTATVLQDGTVLLAGGSNGSIALSSGDVFNPSSLAFVAVGNAMSQARQDHTATRLTDGTVLLAGGSSGGTPTNAADLYRPASNTFAATGSMVDSRASHTATLLDDGTVLVTGGASGPAPMFATNALPSAEIFTITTHRFAQLDAPMSVPRARQTATLLQDGTVLVTGGIDDMSTPLASADVYDPVTKTFTATAAELNVARALHTATALVDGTVLVVGGATAAGDAVQADLFDPTPGAFVPSGSMLEPRQFHTATLLPDGRVLVAGGQNAVMGTLASTEVYDGATYSAGPALAVGRSLHTATPLTNGATKQVLITGGVTAAAGGFVTATADLYTPQAGAAGSVAPTANTISDSRFGHTATLLPNGDILIAGGEDAMGRVLNTTDLFVPDGAGNGSFDLARPAKAKNTMAAGRVYHTATALCDGSVMVAGGRDQNNAYLATVEIYNPATDSFGSIKGGAKGGLMSMPRAFHSATLLSDCSVLIAGGVNQKGAVSALEVYVPVLGKSIPVGSLSAARDLHTATFLSDGTVLLAGGESAASTVVAGGEIYNPFVRIAAPTVGPMLTGRYGHAAVALESGFVLLTGGQDDTFAVTASSELYDPPSGPLPAGAVAVASPVAKLGGSGQRVKAGSVRVSNMSNWLETVTGLTLALSNPSAFSSIRIVRRAGGKTIRTQVDLPAASIQVGCDPPIQLAPGATVELGLEVRLAHAQHGQASVQTLTALDITDWLGGSISSGLPASLGMVSER